MTQDKPEQKTQIKKTLGLSTKKLSIKLPNKNIPSDNFLNKKKGTVVVVTKTKSSKGLKKDENDNSGLTSEENKNRLKAFLNAEKTKILDTNNNVTNVVRKLDDSPINDVKKVESKDTNNEDEIKNLDYIGKPKKEKEVPIKIDTKSPEIEPQPQVKNMGDNKNKLTKLVDKVDDFEDKKK